MRLSMQHVLLLKNEIKMKEQLKLNNILKCMFVIAPNSKSRSSIIT